MNTDVLDNKEKRASKVREMKTQLILDAALAVFSRRGVHEARLEDIAAEAGFSKASLYNYYHDKESIFLSLAIRERTDLAETLQDDSELQLNDDYTFNENLRCLLTVTFRAFSNHFNFLLLLNFFEDGGLLRHGGPSEMMQRFKLLEEKFESRFYRLLNFARERNEMNSPLSNARIYHLFNVIILGVVWEWHNKKQLGDLDATVEETLQFLSAGLGIASPQ